MRRFGLVACAMLYSLSTFLMLGKQPELGKEACLFIVLSSGVYVLADALAGFLKQGLWMDRFASYPVWLRLSVLFVAFVLLQMEVMVLSYGSAFMITMTMLDHTPVILLAGCCVLVSCYMACLPERRLQGLTALLGWMFLAGFVFLVVIGWQMAHHPVLPFSFLRYEEIRQGIWFYLLALYVHIAVLNALCEANERMYIRTGVLLSGIIYGITYLGNLYLLHPDLAAVFDFPTLVSSSLMSYGNFLQRLEWIAVMGIWVCDIVKLAVLLRFLYRLLRVHMPKIWTRYLVLGFGAAAVVLGYFWFPSFDAWQAMFPMVLLSFGGGCLLLWMIV